MECLTWNELAEMIARMTPDERAGPVQVVDPDQGGAALRGAFAIDRIGEIFSGEDGDCAIGPTDGQHHPEHFVLLAAHDEAEPDACHVITDDRTAP
jgi:hypothetical protein